MLPFNAFLCYDNNEVDFMADEKSKRRERIHARWIKFKRFLKRNMTPTWAKHFSYQVISFIISVFLPTPGSVISSSIVSGTLPSKSDKILCAIPTIDSALLL